MVRQTHPLSSTVPDPCPFATVSSFQAQGQRPCNPFWNHGTANDVITRHILYVIVFETLHIVTMFAKLLQLLILSYWLRARRRRRIWVKRLRLSSWNHAFTAFASSQWNSTARTPAALSTRSLEGSRINRIDEVSSIASFYRHLPFKNSSREKQCKPILVADEIN